MARTEILIDAIHLSLDTAALKDRLRIDKGSRLVPRLEKMVAQARVVARPRAFCRPIHIESRGDDFVVAGGIRLTSRVLRINLAAVHRIFPFVVTCGKELDRWAGKMTDTLERFWAEAIRETAMRTALDRLEKEIQRYYHPGKMATMTPGSIDDWPTNEQGALLSLLGSGIEKIGVSLTSGMMMTPTHSLSGIRFPSEASFESCRLCPRKRCPGRRAPYDASLYRRKYRSGETGG